jgi:flotillin
VVYGRTGGSQAKCIHGQGAFVMPLFQDYKMLSLKAMQIPIDLKNTLTHNSTPASLAPSTTPRYQL